MNTRTLVGALLAAGVIGGGVGASIGNIDAFPRAHANPATAAGVAAPLANPRATSLPLAGFTDLVRANGAAVVNVSVEGTRKVAAGMPDIPGLQDHPGLRDFFRGFGDRAPGMPRGDMPTRGLGSGFIVSTDGYILTNAHVVDGAEHVTVRLTDRREYKAKVVGTDEQTDVAVLKIDAQSLPTVKVGHSKDAHPGEWVVAIGSPFGFENSVSAGVVSAKGRSLPDANYVPFLQTDVAVNPGNSGGPLFNLAGEVIGINSQIYSRSGGYQGISFAIPIEVALDVKDQLVQHGKVRRGKLGVTVQEVNAPLAESFGLERPRGALVAGVDPAGAGAKGGLQVGDVILTYDGKRIERSSELPMLVASTTPGRQATVEVWRNRASKTLTLSPSAEAPAKVADASAPAAPGGRLGVAVRPLTPEERGAGASEGLVVEQVSGAAQRAGVQPGDQVLSLNGTAVKSVEELREQVAKAGKNAALLVKRNGQQLFLPVELG